MWPSTRRSQSDSGISCAALASASSGMMYSLRGARGLPWKAARPTPSILSLREVGKPSRNALEPGLRRPRLIPMALTARGLKRKFPGAPSCEVVSRDDFAVVVSHDVSEAVAPEGADTFVGVGAVAHGVPSADVQIPGGCFV